MVEVDTDKDSRQIGTWGLETMGKIMQMKVYLHGLRGIGIEIAKNLALMGVGEITIEDDKIVAIQDLGANFFLKEEDVGNKTRAQAVLEQLQSLNNTVNIQISSGSVDFKEYNVVIMTESTMQENIRINEICRQASPATGFIAAECWGLAGFTFVDFGQQFLVYDKNGEPTKSYVVSSITQENPAIVTVDAEKRHSYEDGDFVVFREVEGMKEINNQPPMMIKVQSPFAFSVCDTSGFGEYVRNGVVDQIKIPIAHSFKSWEESQILSPNANLHIVDPQKFGRPEVLHISFRAIFEFQARNGALPRLNNEEDASAVEAIAQEINAASKDAGGLFAEDLDLNTVKNCARYAQAQISPLAAFWGGIVAHEVIKHTGKYTPLNQWFHFDMFEIAPAEADRDVSGSRYDDYIAIIGKELQNKIQDMNLFLIGAGALGCEFMKSLSLMGACTNGQCVVTDDDFIETSNLSRQFLFRQGDIKKSKSAIAAQAARNMNTAFQIEDRQVRVNWENEEVFNDAFWAAQTCVLNAVDNVAARRHIDERCVWYGKPLLDSGTLGTMCHSLMIIPHQTNTYADVQDGNEDSIAVCTLKNFPHTIEHCIEWARDTFGGEFENRPQAVASYIRDPEEYIAKLPNEGSITVQRNKLEAVKKTIDQMNEINFDSCVAMARQLYQALFHNNIKQLLFNFPQEAKTKDGSPFWSGPKRQPTPLFFNPTDELELSFIVSTANLFAYTFGVEQQQDREQVAKIASGVTVPEFTPSSAVHISSGEGDEAAEDVADDDEEVLAALKESLGQIGGNLKNAKIQATEFEKDDDTNYHIDFIHAVANLRARNYNIPDCDRTQSKMIAGKIVPAIATTTAMVTGVVLFELYKLIAGCGMEAFRDFNANLALPFWMFGEANPVSKVVSREDKRTGDQYRAYPESFTIWDTIEVRGSFTVPAFIEFMQNEHKLRPTQISCGKIAIYMEFMKSKYSAERFEKPIEELYQELSSESFSESKCSMKLILYCAPTPEGEDWDIPAIKYIFK